MTGLILYILGCGLCFFILSHLEEVAIGFWTKVAFTIFWPGWVLCILLVSSFAMWGEWWERSSKDF